MFFENRIKAIDPKLKTATIRDFSGGWDAIDTDLNLSPRFAKVLDNMYRGDGGYYEKRYGTKAFAAGDDGVIVDLGSVSKDVTTTISSNIVNIASTGHGLLTGDHVTIASFSADINGIPATDFNKAFEITRVDADNYNLRTATNATSSGTASRTFDLETNTHTISGVLVNIWYFQDSIIAVDTRGELFKIDSSGIVTKIWSDQFARALSGAPLPWSPMTFASAAAFKSQLVVCNGLDKPLLVDLSGTPDVSYLQDLGSGSNVNTPVCRYVLAMPDFTVMAGDPTAVDRVHISNQSTSGTWLGDGAPNNATQIDVGQFTPSFNQTIRGLARFRKFLLVIFDDSIVPIQLGIFDGSGNHIPTPDESIDKHGTISHRSIMSLGNDVLMADHIGVPTIAHAALTQTIRPDRVSELIDPVIQRNVLRLSVGASDDKVFAVYNPRNRQYMLFMPDYEEGATLAVPYNSVETLAQGSGRIRFYMASAHDLEVGKTFDLSGATAIDGITVGELNTTHTVAAILDDRTFEVDTAGTATNGSTVGGGGSMSITYHQAETIGYIYNSYAALKVRAWARFRQWNWRCGCTSQLGRVFFGADRRIYVYGSREDPVSGDYLNEYDAIWANSTAYVVGDRLYDSTWGRVYRCVTAHTSSPVTTTFEQDRINHPSWWEEYEGDEIDFRWELPWADFDKRAEKKITKYIGLDTVGTAAFNVEMFVDKLYKNTTGTRTPVLTGDFIGGDIGGYGSQFTPFGSARLASDERLWKWPAECKVAKLAFYGSSSRPLGIVSISVAYGVGKVYR